MRPEAEDLPEAIRLHAALSVACLALRMIANGEAGTSAAGAALRVLYRDHPAAREHLLPGAADYFLRNRPPPEELG